MYCRHCAKEIPDDAVVCVGCGRPTGVAMPSQSVVPAKQEEHTGLMIAGVVLAIVMPVVGLIIGIILLAKSKIGAGLGVVILSIVAWAMWCAAMMPSGAGG